MKSVRTFLPFVVGILIFIGVSALVQTHLEFFRAFLTEGSVGTGMAVYVLIGIATVAIPFTSLLPIVPLAVALFGWPITTVLTILAWVIGGQILFEAARFLGKPVMMKFIPTSEFYSIATLLKGKGLLHSILIRMVFHGDIISYAFGLFTHVNSLEFCLVTAVGVTPSAFLYSYFGSLSFRYQLAFIAIALVALVIYWFIDWRQSAHRLPPHQGDPV
jgi:uncharacterized membrane protein YdjX (TVP38/TMEM64 family)